MWLSGLVLLAVLAPPPLELDALLAEVGERAPAVEVAARTVDVGVAAREVAGSWDDPELSVMAEGLSLPGADAEPAMLSYRLAQPIDLFGRRAAARGVAGARIDRDRAGLRRVAWDARARALGLFYELWMNREMRRIVEAQLELLARMRESALARVKAGMDMGHHDVLRAEAQIAAMEAERASLDDERLAIAAMLNTLRGRPIDEAIGEPVLPAPAPLPPLASVRTAAGGAPEIEAAAAMRSEAGALEAQARTMYRPMVMIELQYEQRLGGMADGVGAGVALRLPLWWQRPRREVAMARSMGRAAASEQEAMRAMAAADVSMAWSRCRAAGRTLEALDTAAIPRTRETIASIEAAYAAGRGDFLALLDAIMELRALEARRAAAVVERAVHRFELDRIAGREVTP